MAQQVARRGWGLFVVVIVVLAGAASAGLLLRDVQAPVGASGGPFVGGRPAGTSIGDKASPKRAEPGSVAVVLVEDVAVHPDADRIRNVLQKYFDAINAGDYQLWRSAVIPQWARDIGESAWHAQYRSTLDRSMVVHRLEPRAGGGLVALISFTSLQKPADAPPELPVRCLRWWVSYPLIGEGDQLRLGPSPSSVNLRLPC